MQSKGTLTDAFDQFVPQSSQYLNSGLKGLHKGDVALSATHLEP